MTKLPFAGYTLSIAPYSTTGCHFEECNGLDGSPPHEAIYAMNILPSEA